MEDMNFGPKSIDAQTTTSSDGSTEKSIDTLLPISIDAILPEAGKSVRTYLNNGKVVLGDQKEITSAEKPPEAEKATINLDEEEEQLEEDVEIDRQEGNNVDRPTMINIDRHNENNLDRHSTPATPAVERVYRTLPPFPPNNTQTKRELDKAICKKACDKITLEMPLSDAIKISSSIKKYVKGMVFYSFPAAEHSVMMVSEEDLSIDDNDAMSIDYGSTKSIDDDDSMSIDT
ncbi:hypothetical protein F2Q70_00005049 [Brassica cretica]|uniref:Uncharacterized protein n=1 Tax=Brassica cretica TaxID=69181 RepID=A0A8S9IVR5_BRACR|nr:hypothetical protein F2Q70_00005049 [Brassica cretica]